MRRVGAAAARRRKAGGKMAGGRASATVAEWRALRIALFARSKGRCEVCRSLAPIDPHHIVKRSQGGVDALWNLIALCREHHDMTDAAWADGRLVIRVEPTGHHAYWAIEFRARKGAPLEACLGEGVVALQ